MSVPGPPPLNRPGRDRAPRPDAAAQGKDDPRVLAGRYRLDSVIGKGSMGTVWAATDEILHRQVAIKEIDFPPGTPPAERAQLEHRTLREARAIAALSNPYVITLFDILNLDSGPVIVMELLRARSLAEILRRVGRLPDGQAATIGVAVASGLLAAHAAGITHRDVKPGNVLICDDGRIKLTDFGIARSTHEQTMTATGLLLGSPAYIAPEVANGVPAGPISDAWSLGGLLFASVEGRPPFDQGTAIATLTSVVKDPVPPHPHSGRLGAVVSGLLVKTPNLRMRIDRALTIMRGIADDPSGTNLAAVTRIPRDDAVPLPATGAVGPGGPSGPGGPGGPTSSAIGSPQTRGADPRASLHATPRPPVSSPADASTYPPGTPVVGPPGFRAGAVDARPAAPGPNSWSPAGSGSFGRTPQPHPDMRSNPLDSNVFQRADRPAERHAEVLPPPPWAHAEAAALAPLPAAAPPTSQRLRVAAAIVAAVIAALVGYFGVRVIADLATNSASSGSTGSTSTGSTGTGSTGAGSTSSNPATPTATGTTEAGITLTAPTTIVADSVTASAPIPLA